MKVSMDNRDVIRRIRVNGRESFSLNFKIAGVRNLLLGIFAFAGNPASLFCNTNHELIGHGTRLTQGATNTETFTST